MKNFRNFIIKALGGIPLDEHYHWVECQYHLGRFHMAYWLTDAAKALNGLTGDEWCKEMWTALLTCKNNAEADYDGTVTKFGKNDDKKNDDKEVAD